MTTRQRGFSVPAAPAHVPLPKSCSARSEQPGAPNLHAPGSCKSETVTTGGQDKDFCGRIRSVALAGFEIVRERSTFLHSCDWYMENVSISQELFSWRKLSKYYFKQTLSFKGLNQTYFSVCVVFKRPECEPEPSKCCESGKART